MMNQIQAIVFYSSLSIASTLFIYDSILLFIRGKNNRARQMLGFTTLIWGIMYLIIFIVSLTGHISFPIFSGKGLISSHLFICIMFLFPLEVLLPGWMNMKRACIMLTPITIISIIYFIGLTITDQHIEEFISFQELKESISKFNVWYRFVIFICNFIFIYILMNLLNRNEIKYLKWQNENFSDKEDVDISWMNYYKNMITIIFLCYLFVVIWGSVWSIILHTFIVIICFSILFYKGLFYENSYPADFSNSSEGITKDTLTNETVITDVKVENMINEHSFEAKLPTYVETLRQWMETEKPYLYKDFKLTDSTRVLPLNRSYLSRVFNEGFNQNFSEVVRSYRISYAKETLSKYPDLPLYKVAKLCGFASDSTFIRAFQKVTGITPTQYKSQL